MHRGRIATQEPPLNVGDRVRIQQDRWPLPGLVDQVGTVVEIFRIPLNSCLVRLDGDTTRGREWFFYRAEVMPGDV